MDIIRYIKKNKKIEDPKLKMLLGLSNQTYNKYKQKGMDEKELARMLIRLIDRTKIDGQFFTDQLIKNLKNKM